MGALDGLANDNLNPGLFAMTEKHVSKGASTLVCGVIRFCRCNQGRNSNILTLNS